MDSKISSIDDVKYLLYESLHNLDASCKEGQIQIILKFISDSILLLSNQVTTYTDCFKESESQFENEYGESIRVTVNQIIIYRLYIDNLPKIKTLNVPEKILNYLEDDFSRALKIANKGEKALLTFMNTQFSKYIDTLCLSLLPLGNQGVVENGISRSILFKQSPLNFIKFGLLLIRLGGNRFFFEIHYNQHRFRQFNHEGWNNVFECGAELLSRHTNIKGIFGVSWFFDPKIEDISPELKYIRTIIRKIGGHFFFFGRSANDKRNAFAMSYVRKKAFEEGQYDPASYIAIIPRKSLLKYYGL